MTRRRAFIFTALMAVALTACESDREVGPEGGSAFRRYVSIGTSISEGWQSDGVVYTSQVAAWPALLARQAMVPFGSPLIQAPGCNPPLIAPLQLSRRLFGSAAAASTRCAANFPGITLPQNNVAISGALATEALNRAALAAPATTRDSLYRRTLAVGQTQVTAMLAQNPTFVSVELGANEVLGGATSGLLVPGTTIVPFAAFEPEYVKIIDSVESTGARALLVTVPLVGSIPSLRLGSELFAVANEFLAFNIQVNANCQTSTNLVFTPQLVPRKVAEGQALAAAGQRAQLSCADAPGTVDYILTPADTATINGIVRSMNTLIGQQATGQGYALLEANTVLQHIVSTRPAYSVVKHLGCTSPFGQYISLDGVHPSNAGHVLIANAAAEAVNAHYGFSIPAIPIEAIPNDVLCP